MNRVGSQHSGSTVDVIPRLQLEKGVRKIRTSVDGDGKDMAHGNTHGPAIER